MGGKGPKIEEEKKHVNVVLVNKPVIIKTPLTLRNQILTIFLHVLFLIQSMDNIFVKLDYYKCRFLWCLVRVAILVNC